MGIFDKFFASTAKKRELRLEDVVGKTSDTGYVFLDMNNDLAQCSFNWHQASPQLLMAYGYARRTIASSLLIQGGVDKETYTHTASLFRDIQSQTIHTVEFQEQAARDAEAFMATYDPRIDRVVTGRVVGLAKAFEPFSALVPLDDSRLFSALLHQDSLAVIPSDLSQITTEHIGLLVKRDGDAKAGDIVRRAAAAGSIDSAVFLSALYGKAMDKEGSATSAGVATQYVHYTEMAAARGDETSQYNLGLHHMRQCDVDNGQMSPEGYESLRRAEFWYKKAAAAGYAPAAASLKEIDGLLVWAHRAFSTVASSDDEDDQDGSMSFIQESIEKNGWQGAVTIAAMTVISRIPSEDVAYQFILEELDGASQGNEYSREHARNSGISPQEYSGALSRSNPEVDGPDGPQQMLMAMSFQLSADRDKMAKFRCDVGSAVMEHFQLGAYARDDEDID